MKLFIALATFVLLGAQVNCATAFVPLPTNKVTTQTPLFLQPLANEGEWAAYLDEDNTGLIYYFNAKTGESLWEPPTTTFPAVRLQRAERKVARTLQRQYRKKNQKQQEQGGETKGFLSGVLSTVAEEEKTVTEEPAKPEPESKWFDGLFDTPKGAAASATKQDDKPPVTANDEKQEESNWFDGFFETPTEDPIVAEKKVLVEKKKPKEEESTTGFSFGVFGSKSETKEPAVNGSSAARSTPKQQPNTSPATKDKTPASDKSSKQDEEAEKVRFGGLRKVANVFKRSEPAQVKPQEPISIDVASYVLPHPAKVSWGGEDAVFVKGRTFGVFDGVSGAEKLDGIPLYSKTLAEETKNLVGEGGLTTKEISSVMLEAAEFADKSATGASTAVIASVTEDGYLRVVNLGDSVCLLVRDNAVRSKTREIVHYFECPYQLAEDSPDRPKDATKLNVEVLPGDLILMGSDGVFDNLSDKTICETIAESGPNDSSYAIAKRIVDLSRKVSLDKTADTPYAPLARKNGDPDFKSGKGGKVDDASCVVVRCS